MKLVTWFALLLLGSCQSPPLRYPSTDAGVAAGDDLGTPDLATSPDDATVPPPDLAMNPVSCGMTDPKAGTPGPLAVMGTPAAFACLGRFMDPPGPAQSTTVHGVLRDFQDDNPISGAIVTVYASVADAIADKALATSAPSDANGAYTMVVPAGFHRVVRRNEGGRANSNGNLIKTVPVLEVGRRYDDTAAVGVKLTTIEVIPGLLSVTQMDGNGLLLGRVLDCNEGSVANAFAAVKSGTWDAVANAQLFYFADVAGSVLPLRNQRATLPLGLFTALNVPPGTATVCAFGVVGNGAPRTLSSKMVPVIANAVTFIDLLPN